MAFGELRVLLAIVLVASLALPASAQDFKVLDVLPLSGQSKVPLEATVKFSFNSPVDTSARFDGDGPLAFFQVAPQEEITVHDLRFNEDLTEATFEVTHHDSIDYVWILTGVRSVDGSLLCQPFVLSYTTRESNGSALVEGDAEIIVATKVSSCLLRAVASLLDSYPDSNASVLAAATVNENGFVLDGIRPGTYWPVLLIDWDSDGHFRPTWSEIGEVSSEVGAYDSNGDGAPDSLQIADTTSIEIVLGAYGSSAENGDGLPEMAKIVHAYPNPSMGDARVAFELARAASPTIAIYDMLGRHVSTSSLGLLAPGTHEVNVDANDLPAGIYVIRVEAPHFAASRTIVLLQ